MAITVKKALQASGNNQITSDPSANVPFWKNKKYMIIAGIGLAALLFFLLRGKKVDDNEIGDEGGNTLTDELSAEIIE